MRDEPRPVNWHRFGDALHGDAPRNDAVPAWGLRYNPPTMPDHVYRECIEATQEREWSWLPHPRWQFGAYGGQKLWPDD